MEHIFETRARFDINTVQNKNTLSEEVYLQIVDDAKGLPVWYKPAKGKRELVGEVQSVFKEGNEIWAKYSINLNAFTNDERNAFLGRRSGGFLSISSTKANGIKATGVDVRNAEPNVYRVEGTDSFQAGPLGVNELSPEQEKRRAVKHGVDDSDEEASDGYGE